MKTKADIPASANREVARLQQRVESVRVKQWCVIVAHGLLLVLGTFVFYFATVMLFDWLVELPWIVRFLLLLPGLGGIGFLVWKHLVYPLKHQPNDDAIALMIEREMPIFRTRFIASIQLARTQHNVLVRALIAETAAMASKLKFRWVVKTDRLIKVAKSAVTVFVVVSGLVWLEGWGTWPLFKRAWLFNDPVPRKTNIISVSGDSAVGIGDNLIVDAVVEGFVPRAGRLMVETAAGKMSEYPMEADSGNSSRFSRMLQSVQEPFTYRVRLNDSVIGPFQVKVLPRPTVLSITCEQTYPAYTGLGDVKRALGDLSLLAGSQLALEIKASSPLKRAWIRMAGLPQEVRMEVDPREPDKATATLTIPAKDLTGFSVQMIDKDGIAAKDTAIYRVDILPDRSPVVKITYPVRREELITPQGTLLIAFDASDDFGLDKLVLHYAIDQVNNGAGKTTEFNIGASRKNLANHFEWKIATLNPPPPVGSTIEYWLEAKDSNTITGPGVGVTEHYQVKVVTGNEKRADLSNRITDAMSGLGEMTDTQEQITRSLGALIFEKPPQNQ